MDTEINSYFNGSHVWKDIDNIKDNWKSIYVK